MSNVAERYSRAITSSKLALKDAPCDADVLIAAGWADKGSVATALYRMQHTGRHHGFGEVTRVVCEWVNGRVKARAIKTAGKRTKLIVERTLFWWLMHICLHCGGRGHPNFPGTPVMKDDEDCPHCVGTGFAPLESVIPAAHMDMAKLIISEIERDAHGVFHRMEVALKS